MVWECAVTHFGTLECHMVSPGLRLKTYRGHKMVMNALKIVKHHSKCCVLLKITTRGHSSSNLDANKLFLWFLQVGKLCGGSVLTVPPLAGGMFMLLSDYDTVFSARYSLPFLFELHRLLINGFRQLKDRNFFFLSKWLFFFCRLWFVTGVL